MTSKEEWFAIVDQEEGQKLVLNVMEEVLDKTQNVIFRRRIENQLLPYTLSYVRNTFLGVAEVGYSLIDVDIWTVFAQVV